MRIVVVTKCSGGFSGVLIYRFQDTEDAEGFAKDVEEYADRVASRVGGFPDSVYVLDPDDAGDFANVEVMRKRILDSKGWAL